MKLKFQCIASFIASIALLASISCSKEEEEEEGYYLTVCNTPYYAFTIDSLSFTVNNLKDIKQNSLLFQKDTREENLIFEKTTISLKVERTINIINPVTSESTFEENNCSNFIDIHQKINSIAISLSEPITVHNIQRKANENINDLFVVDFYWEKKIYLLINLSNVKKKKKDMLGYYDSETILKLKENIEIKNTTLALKIDFDTGKNFEFSTDTFKSPEVINN